jgi:translation initiation factor 2 alpha subunit (eIF-2alpha)
MLIHISIFCLSVGHIELSKLQVTDDEHKKCDDKYHRAVTADGVLRYVSDQTEIEVSVAQLYEDIGWPLVEKYGSLYDAFIASKKYIHPLSRTY